MHKLSLKIISALALISLLPSVAMADHEPEGGSTVMVISTAPSTTSSTSAIVLITATNPFFSSSTSSTTADTLFGSTQNTEQYMRANAVAMQEDIAVGGGRTIEDLASMCGLKPEDMSAFAKLLREQREPLIAMLEPSGLDATRAIKFAAHIEDAMRQDQRLLNYTRQR